MYPKSTSESLYLHAVNTKDNFTKSHACMQMGGKGYLVLHWLYSGLQIIYSKTFMVTGFKNLKNLIADFNVAR